MENNRIVVATGNKNKLLELQTVSKKFGLELLSPEDIAKELEKKSLPIVEENENTFRGNALLKAKAYMQWCGLPTIGDDSGLEVFALEGRPGVHSARYAGAGASDQEKYLKVINELEITLKKNPEKDRRARFYCYLVLSMPDGKLIEADGELVGEVLKEPRGDKGFGYDPIIYIDSLNATLAEVDFKVTCSQGFRAIAAEKLFSLFISYCNKQTKNI